MHVKLQITLFVVKYFHLRKKWLFFLKAFVSLLPFVILQHGNFRREWVPDCALNVAWCV